MVTVEITKKSKLLACNGEFVTNGVWMIKNEYIQAIKSPANSGLPIKSEGEFCFKKVGKEKIWSSGQVPNFKVVLDNFTTKPTEEQRLKKTKVIIKSSIETYGPEVDLVLYVQGEGTIFAFDRQYEYILDNFILYGDKSDRGCWLYSGNDFAGVMMPVRIKEKGSLTTENFVANYLGE